MSDVNGSPAVDDAEMVLLLCAEETADCLQTCATYLECALLDDEVSLLRWMYHSPAGRP